MSTTKETKPWDFSHVLGLVNSLSLTSNGEHFFERIQNGDSGTDNAFFFADGINDHVKRTDLRDSALSSVGLGDFSKVYQYLGTPLHSPAPAVQAQQASEVDIRIQSLPSKYDYASDGATYFKTNKGNGKAVKWLDREGTEGQTTDTFSDGSVVPDTPTLTKTQRKKKNRKERKAREAARAAESGAKATTVSESEAESISRKTPARKASAHIIATTPKRYNLREREASGSAVTANCKASDPLLESAKLAVKRLDAAKQANAQAFSAQPPATRRSAPSTDPVNKNTELGPHPAKVNAQSNGGASTYAALQSQPKQQWPVTTPSSIQFLPASVQPLPYTPPSANSTAQHHLPNQQSAPSKPPRAIEPLIVRTGEDRHWALLMKLLGDFWTDRSYLISPMNLTTHNNDPKGIHVFVDASNIFIGFNDQLKRSRGIPTYVQIPPVHLSFDALALLMERRRPVAKRVLVGSTPHLPAFDKAKAVGYECSILEKVYKARELTDRQIFFQEHDRHGNRKVRAKAPPANNVGLVNGGLCSGNGSGSETNAPQYAPARMIEQGVDEILHLKILESVVDTDVPGNIVLATGDAAQAEYSQGFMAMAERALKKGWAVELVSWSKNISAMYTRREWMQAWGDRFRIIYLDDYAEELLDM